MGGKEYRGVRTERYTYARDLNGPWLLYDNETDPYQLRNLVNIQEYAELQKEMEMKLDELLKKTKDEFRDADYYMKKWNYNYD
jgi:arylsulfatase A-like enzyme